MNSDDLEDALEVLEDVFPTRLGGVVIVGERLRVLVVDLRPIDAQLLQEHADRLPVCELLPARFSERQLDGYSDELCERDVLEALEHSIHWDVLGNAIVVRTGRELSDDETAALLGPVPAAAVRFEVGDVPVAKPG